MPAIFETKVEKTSARKWVAMARYPASTYQEWFTIWRDSHFRLKRNAVEFCRFAESVYSDGCDPREAEYPRKAQLIDECARLLATENSRP